MCASLLRFHDRRRRQPRDSRRPHLRSKVACELLLSSLADRQCPVDRPCRFIFAFRCARMCNCRCRRRMHFSLFLTHSAPPIISLNLLFISHLIYKVLSSPPFARITEGCAIYLPIHYRVDCALGKYDSLWSPGGFLHSGETPSEDRASVC